MDELVDRIVANVGVDRTVAEKSVGIIFDFLAKEGPSEKVHALLDGLPGANEAIAAAREGDTGGMFGGMGGIMPYVGGLLGIIGCYVTVRVLMFGNLK